MKKRKQHYVWGSYLSAWANRQNQIWCKNTLKIFQTNIINIANKRDFYRLREINDDEIDIIKKIAINRSHDLLKKSHLKFLELFTMPFNFKKILKSNNMFDKNTEKEFDVLINNLEENLHCEIENSGKQYLDLILQDNISFYDNPDDRDVFLSYLTVQYMRTAKIKSNVLRTTENNKIVDIEKIWNIISHILGKNLACNLTIRNNYKVYLFKNSTEQKFITTDQPVINLYAVDRNIYDPVEKIKIYYPVSPERALLISNEETGDNIIDLPSDKINYYNSAMIKEAHEQIYSSSKEQLEQIFS